MKRKAILCAAIVTIASILGSPSWAMRPGEMLSDPALEARARIIGQQLRCLVCQNESIDDSDADLAHDLRLLVRHRLLAGDSDKQAIQYIVARYGTYVLLKPPFDEETYLLWFGPFVLLAAGVSTAIVFFRRSGRAGMESAPLSPDEQRRFSALIGDAPARTIES